ncbi:tumor protein d52 [Echinococcus multilocularis]|uniref:Tumor protein d52 n=1 Tax=Echinococcus multilocularis TaxID=6211 RepID=A0A068YHX5_ECHMU|nr:tumor protein d52 [Echinococcus multilocularis]
MLLLLGFQVYFVGINRMEIGDDATAVVNTEPVSEGEDILNREELERELVATEDDIQTLKEALNVKIKHLVEIKKKLGHTDITTISYDVREGLTRFGESETMQKTQRAFAQARSKTIDVAEDVKEKITTSFENIKNSDTFKNISETMGSAFGTIKDAIVKSTYGTLPEDGD